MDSDQKSPLIEPQNKDLRRYCIVGNFLISEAEKEINKRLAELWGRNNDLLLATGLFGVLGQYVSGGLVEPVLWIAILQDSRGFALSCVVPNRLVETQMGTGMGWQRVSFAFKVFWEVFAWMLSPDWNIVRLNSTSPKSCFHALFAWKD